tara:strand:- start:5027 stop:5272 length:246 start_codon:yes stop_codon:yes gene_type:complete
MSQQFLEDCRAIELDVAETLAEAHEVPIDKVRAILHAYRADVFTMVVAAFGVDAMQRTEEKQAKYGARAAEDGTIEITRPS